jgi:hypothetical protein
MRNKTIHIFFILAFLLGCETVSTIDGPETRQRYQKFLNQYNETQYSDQAFTSGKLRLRSHNFVNASSGTSSNIISKAYQSKKWVDLSKLTYVTMTSSNLGYFYLGIAAENLGYLEAAHEYFELALGSYHPYANFVVPQCEKQNLCNSIQMPNEIYKGIVRVSNNNPDVMLAKYMPVQEELTDWTYTLLNVSSALLQASVIALAAYGGAYSDGYESPQTSSSKPSMIYSSDGSYYNVVGNSIIGPNGSYYTVSGNVITGPDGQTSVISGNSIFSSDGSIITKAGNTYISSNGSSCTQVGSVVTCN